MTSTDTAAQMSAVRNTARNERRFFIFLWFLFLSYISQTSYRLKTEVKAPISFGAAKLSAANAAPRSSA